MNLNKFAAILSVGFIGLTGSYSSYASGQNVFKETQNSTITYVDDIAPILKKRCVECHRQGEVAPMSFDSYQNTRPWAKSIIKTVKNEEMPPWFADPDYGVFSNANVLTEEEKSKIERWVSTGAPRGAGEEPNMTEGFSDGWQIGEPDMVFTMPEAFVVPSEGTVEYQYFKVPTNFKEDRWLKAAEARPGNRGVVHHIIAFIKDGKSSGGIGLAGGNMLAGYAPGLKPYNFSKMGDIGLLVPAGSDIIFQMHYTANGEEASDQSSIGVIFRDTEPRYKAQVDAIINPSFTIPAGAENHRVTVSKRFTQDTEVIAFMPHMHLRGKDFKYTLVRKDGTKEVLLSVPNYNFEWQLHYDLEEPVIVRKGDKIFCEAHFDNSANNEHNPDPTIDVRWGDQSWEEMMIGWYTRIEENENYEGHEQAYMEDLTKNLAEQRTARQDLRNDIKRLRENLAKRL